MVWDANQLTNQPTDRPINQPTNQPTDQPSTYFYSCLTWWWLDRFHCWRTALCLMRSYPDYLIACSRSHSLPVSVCTSPLQSATMPLTHSTVHINCNDHMQGRLHHFQVILTHTFLQHHCTYQEYLAALLLEAPLAVSRGLAESAWSLRSTRTFL